MKNKALYILLVIVFFVVSCKTDKQQVANKNIERYIKSKLDNPNSFELVSIKKLEKDRYFTSLDSIAPINDLFDYKQYEVYADTADRDRPWVRASNLNDLKINKSGMYNFYKTDCTFRIKVDGQQKLLKYHFELDTLFNVKNSEDISDEIEVIR
jgi:hypothetical protein